MLSPVLVFPSLRKPDRLSFSRFFFFVSLRGSRSIVVVRLPFFLSARQASYGASYPLSSLREIGFT